MKHDRHHIVFCNVILKFLLKLYVTIITFVNNNSNCVSLLTSERLRDVEPIRVESDKKL